MRKASGKEEVLKRAPYRPKPPLPRPLTGAFARGKLVERLIKGQRKDRISEIGGLLFSLPVSQPKLPAQMLLDGARQGWPV